MSADGSEAALLVVVVTYNSAAVLGDFAASLPAGLAGVTSCHVVIADNASPDHSADLARRLLPDATVVETGGNFGYAAGINAAIAARPGDEAVLVLNPDLQLRPGAAVRLLRELAIPGTGLVVPRIVGPDGRLHLSLRRDPSVLRALGEAVLGGRRAGRWARLGGLVVDPAFYDRPGQFDWASGAAMLVSRRCLDATGPWDDSFFLYSEETEFALRARDRGWLLRYVPDATVVHIGGDAPTSPILWSLLTLNRVRLFRRRHGALSATAFRAALTLGTAARAATGRRTDRAALRTLLTATPPKDLLAQPRP